MDEKKRKQHYVFQAYLKAWTNDEKIWVKRKDGNPFNTNIINIAQERDFYRIKPINDDEIKFFDMLLLRKAHQDVRNSFLDYIKIYQVPIKRQEYIQKLRQDSELLFGGNDNLPEELKIEIVKLEESTDISVNNVIEDYYSDIEGESIKWIESLKNGNYSFYYTADKKIINEKPFNDEKYHFLFFLCTQYFRTKAMKERWILNFEPCLDDSRWSTLGIPRENINLENLVHPFMYFMINTCSYSLHEKKVDLTILLNETDVPFITSDQPVVNLKADYSDLSKQTNELIFYYPIAPNIAITVNDENGKKKINLNINKVDEYNKAIIRASYQNIFTNSTDVFNRYLDDMIC